MSGVFVVKHVGLTTSEQALNEAEVHVFSDSVLCMGKGADADPSEKIVNM